MDVTSRLAWARGPRIIILWLASPPPGRDHSRGARLPQPAARATNHSRSCRMVGGMMRAAHTNHANKHGAHSDAKQGMQAPPNQGIRVIGAATKIQALHRGNSERSLVAARRRAAEDKKRRERKSRGKSHGHGRKTKGAGTSTLCCCISVSATVEPSG